MDAPVWLNIVLVLVAVIAVPYLVVKLLGVSFRAIGWVFRHVWAFVSGVLGDSARLIGALLVAIALVPLTLLNVAIGRWSAAVHFGRSLQHEVATVFRSGYRVVIGHPARFLLMGDVVRGIEERLPAAVAKAPGSDRPSKRTGVFEGYVVEGSLKGGGSGGRLYVAKPDEAKRVQLERAGMGDVDRVVIKSFSLLDGSSMPQIVRESKALESARKLGLVLEHEMGEERFFYVMRYVPGETLGEVAGQLHAAGTAEGLGTRGLREVVGYVCDLLSTLDGYHRGGLWHKDVKPDNLIVHAGRAHLVDLGLVTPLRSAMTLTTHGTEYFRDPELVRMAMRGAKVHEVDGALFDVYGAGAVLYSVVENSFPAHGALSRVTKRCPEALKWVIRRSMADLNRRYGSSAEMLEDLRVIANAEDPWSLKPKDLPSVNGDVASLAADDIEGGAEEVAFAATPASFTPWRGDEGGGDAGARRVPPPLPVMGGVGAGPREGTAGVGRGEAAGVRARPKIKVKDWVTGGYTYEPMVGVAADEAAGRGARHAPRRHVAADVPEELRPRAGGSAKEQVRRARERARLNQRRVEKRMGRMRDRSTTRPNAGVFVALALMIAVILGVVVVGGGMFTLARSEYPGSAMESSPAAPGTPALLSPPPGSVLNEGGMWEGFMRHHGTQRIEFAVPMFGGAEVGGEAPLTGAAERLNGGAVLVLARKANGALSMDEWGRFDRLLERFRRDGVTLAGDGMLVPATDDVAMVLAEVGTGGLSNERQRFAVRDWLVSDPRYAAVLWLEVTPEGRSRVLLGEDGLVEGALRESLEAWATGDATLEFELEGAAGEIGASLSSEQFRVLLGDEELLRALESLGTQFERESQAAGFSGAYTIGPDGQIQIHAEEMGKLLQGAFASDRDAWRVMIERAMKNAEPAEVVETTTIIQPSR